jgi:phosphotransferase system HPr (HPr) family protein
MDESVTTRRIVKLAHRNGLHLTPIQLLVKAVSDHSAVVRVHFGGMSANARSAMDLMLLGATFGANLDLEASGVDAESALSAAEAVLSATGD